MRSWRSHTALLILLAWTGCVDKVDFVGSGNSIQFPFVIEGHVSNEDTARVYISKAYPADGKYYTTPVSSATVWIAGLDDGMNWQLSNSPGGKQFGAMYKATSIMPVTIGNRYQLHVTLPGGQQAASIPQVVQASGEIQNLYFEYVAGFNRDTGVPENGFNVFVDGLSPVESDWYIRWTFNGTYFMRTEVSPTCVNCPTECWVSEHEDRPVLAHSDFVANRSAARNFLKYIPISIKNFSDRYHVEVVQEVISRDAWEFYRDIRYQIDNSSSLFQPTFSAIKGNMYTSGASPVIGIFTASQTTRETLYILQTDVPFKVRGAFPTGPCTSYPHSSATPPPFWK